MRPFCIVTLGSIIGIIMGLYFNSIALFSLLIILIFLSLTAFNITINKSNKKYIKYMYVFLIFLVLFYGYTYHKEKNYKKINEMYNRKEIQVKAVVISDKTQKEYKDTYQIKITEIIVLENEQKEHKLQNAKNAKNKQNFKMILNLKKNKNQSYELKYGDEIKFTSTYEEPEISRNEGGFDYKNYLKTKQIVGTTSVKQKKIKVIGKDRAGKINTIMHTIKNIAVKKIKEVLPNDSSILCSSLLLGEKSDLSENIQSDFRKSSLSHMLAISGAHVSYILHAINNLIQKLKLHKRWGKLVIIVFLIFFMALVRVYSFSYKSMHNGNTAV